MEDVDYMKLTQGCKKVEEAKFKAFAIVAKNYIVSLSNTIELC